MNNTEIYYGTAVKDLGNGKVGGYALLYTTSSDPDLVGDFFTPDSNFKSGNETDYPVYYCHTLDKTLDDRELGRGEFIKSDEVGMWFEAQLNLRDKYEQMIYKLAKDGKLGWSTGSVSHLVRREAVKSGVNWVKSWPIAEVSLTPMPAEPRTTAIPVKSLDMSNTWEAQYKSMLHSDRRDILESALKEKFGEEAEYIDHDDSNIYFVKGLDDISDGGWKIPGMHEEGYHIPIDFGSGTGNPPRPPKNTTQRFNDWMDENPKLVQEAAALAAAYTVYKVGSKIYGRVRENKMRAQPYNINILDKADVSAPDKPVGAKLRFPSSHKDIAGMGEMSGMHSHHKQNLHHALQAKHGKSAHYVDHDKQNVYFLLPESGTGYMEKSLSPSQLKSTEIDREMVGIDAIFNDVDSETKGNYQATLPQYTGEVVNILAGIGAISAYISAAKYVRDKLKAQPYKTGRDGSIKMADPHFDAGPELTYSDTDEPDLGVASEVEDHLSSLVSDEFEGAEYLDHDANNVYFEPDVKGLDDIEDGGFRVPGYMWMDPPKPYSGSSGGRGGWWKPPINLSGVLTAGEEPDKFRLASTIATAASIWALTYRINQLEKEHKKRKEGQKGILPGVTRIGANIPWSGYETSPFHIGSLSANGDEFTLSLENMPSVTQLALATYGAYRLGKAGVDVTKKIVHAVKLKKSGKSVTLDKSDPTPVRYHPHINGEPVQPSNSGHGMSHSELKELLQDEVYSKYGPESKGLVFHNGIWWNDKYFKPKHETPIGSKRQVLPQYEEYIDKLTPKPHWKPKYQVPIGTRVRTEATISESERSAEEFIEKTIAEIYKVEKLDPLKSIPDFEYLDHDDDGVYLQDVKGLGYQHGIMGFDGPYSTPWEAISSQWGSWGGLGGVIGTALAAYGAFTLGKAGVDKLMGQHKETKGIFDGGGQVEPGKFGLDPTSRITLGWPKPGDHVGFQYAYGPFNATKPQVMEGFGGSREFVRAGIEIHPMDILAVIGAYNLGKAALSHGKVYYQKYKTKKAGSTKSIGMKEIELDSEMSEVKYIPIHLNGSRVDDGGHPKTGSSVLAGGKSFTNVSSTNIENEFKPTCSLSTDFELCILQNKSLTERLINLKELRVSQGRKTALSTANLDNLKELSKQITDLIELAEGVTEKSREISKIDTKKLFTDMEEIDSWLEEI